jgi:hypothetical protein
MITAVAAVASSTGWKRSTAGRDTGTLATVAIASNASRPRGDASTCVASASKPVHKTSSDTRT